MASNRRVNIQRVKRHRTYSRTELAALLGVHKNTVRNWQRHGLDAIDTSRPALFHGEGVRAFLGDRRARSKRPCPPGTFFCFGCRDARPPALGMVDFVDLRPGTGNLCAVCAVCGTMMHRSARRNELHAVMPGIAVQITEAATRLVGCSGPSVNCSSESEGEV